MWELKVDGMESDSAAATITGAILRVDPGARVNVDIPTQLVQVRSLWREAEIRAVLENAGFSVREARMVA